MFDRIRRYVRTGKNGVASALIGVLSLSCASTALAADVDHRFSLSLGVFLTDRASDTRLDVTGGSAGTPTDLEADLGLDNSDSVFRIDGYYRFSDKHRLDFSAFDLSRTSMKQIEKEIMWDDAVFPIDAAVTAEVDLNIYKLAYTWSFMRRDSGYLGLTAGLYVADVGTYLSAENIANRAGGGVTAPLPVIGLRGEHQISDKWTFRASGEFFAIEYDAFDGSLIDLYIGVDYALSERFSVGLGVNSVQLDVGIDEQDLDANLDWRYDGGMLFVKFDF